MYLVRLSWSGGRVELKPDDFLIKFQIERKERESTSSSKKKIEDMSPEEIEAEKARISAIEKTAWFGMFGLAEDGSVKDPGPRQTTLPPMFSQDQLDLRTR